MGELTAPLIWIRARAYPGVFKCVVRDIGGKMTMKVQFATVVAAMMVLSGTVIAEKPLKPLPNNDQAPALSRECRFA
jgi:hypothetical protein